MTSISSIGKLLSFISEVAITLRMNSSYCGASNNNEHTSDNVRWLSDMLHNLNSIGDALQTGSNEEIQYRINLMIRDWSDRKDTFERAKNLSHGHGDWSVEQGIVILKEIRESVIIQKPDVDVL